MYRYIVNVTRDISTMINVFGGVLRVVVYANRVCNSNVTLPQKRIPAGILGDRLRLRPDAVDLISNPLEYFENTCAENVAQQKN